MPAQWRQGRGPGPTTYRATLARGLEIGIWYEGIETLAADAPKWNASVFGIRLRDRSPTEEHAKGRAEKQAELLLTEALQALAP